MKTHVEFIESLKVGDPVIVVEGFNNIDGNLSKVIVITSDYIQTELYPGFRYDRQTGKQLPPRGGGLRNRYLLCPEELQAQKDYNGHKERLVDLLNEHTITVDQFNRCYSALKEILNG